MVEFNPEVKGAAGVSASGSSKVNGTPEQAGEIEVFDFGEDSAVQSNVKFRPDYKSYQDVGEAIGQSLYDMANIKQFMFHSNKNAYSQMKEINASNVFFAVNQFNTASKDSQMGILEFLNNKKGFEPKELAKVIDSMLEMADANGIHNLSGEYLTLKSYSTEFAGASKIEQGKAALADENMVRLMRKMNDSLQLVDDKDITRMTDPLVRRNLTGAIGTGYDWREVAEENAKKS